MAPESPASSDSYEVLSLLCSPDDSPALEHWIAQTCQIPVLVLEEDPCRISFTPPSATPLERLLLEEALRSMGAWNLQTDFYERRDWQELWKEQGFKRFTVGETLTVVPAWDPDPVEEPAIRIDPQLAFGTGWHETTHCCLERILEKNKCQGATERVLDFGAGTGILGIAALRVAPGATLLAIDNDPYAVEATKENLRLNRMEDRGRVIEGDGQLFSGSMNNRDHFDLVIANVTGTVLVGMVAILWERVSPGGWLVCSGVDKEEASAVEDSLGALGSPFRVFAGNRYNTYCLMKEESHG